MKSYLVKFGLFSLLISLAGYFLREKYGFDLLHQYFFEMQLALAALTFINHRICLESIEKQPDMFHLYYMGTMTVRFFIALGCITSYLYLQLINPNVFALNFLVLYLFYTIFEIYTLLANLRPNKKQL